MNWRTFTGKPIEQSLLEKVRTTLQTEKAMGHRLKVCIGTDSKVKGAEVEFATVVVFLREKKGGFMYISNVRKRIEMTIKERMISEVGRSIEVAYELSSLLDEYQVALEVHADINTDPSFKSEPALKDAMGYILGMGFVFRAKPDAFASSSCADRVV